MRCIEKPNLPTTKVKKVIISPIKEQVILGLKQLGIEPIFTEIGDLERLPVAHHADMSAHHLGGKQMLVRDGDMWLTKALINNGFEVAFSKVGENYPSDCALNCMRIGNIVIAGKNSISREIKSFCYENGQIINYVNQGYAKCSTAIVAKNAIITADVGIAKEASELGIDVLIIKEGNIAINKYDTGFIGGTCGKLSHDILAFCGNVKAHPSFEEIIFFCRSHEVYCEQICGGELFDIGGILPITESELKNCLLKSS